MDWIVPRQYGKNKSVRRISRRQAAQRIALLNDPTAASSTESALSSPLGGLPRKMEILTDGERSEQRPGATKLPAFL